MTIGVRQRPDYEHPDPAGRAEQPMAIDLVHSPPCPACCRRAARLDNNGDPVVAAIGGDGKVSIVNSVHGAASKVWPMAIPRILQAVAAAKAMGSSWRVTFRHVIPVWYRALGRRGRGDLYQVCLCATTWPA